MHKLPAGSSVSGCQGCERGLAGEKGGEFVGGGVTKVVGFTGFFIGLNHRQSRKPLDYSVISWSVSPRACWPVA